MLQVEAAALALLLARRRKAVEEATRARQWPAARVFAALNDTIFLARTSARTLAFGRLTTQFPDIPFERAPSAAAVDRIRATQLARRQVADLEARIAKMQAERLSAEASWGRALEQTTARIATTAATETFSAAAAERSVVVRLVADEYELLKVWDAQLDACPRCWRLDGTIVAADANFPGGEEPGVVHPNCRCWYTILRGTKSGRTFNIEPRHAA